ncbi:MAG: single-stranded-DNA-specific exonuclease RecJ [Patescibacteria group bacterium]|nr:single-stranded-DNA-specific exonuclease RecJ [Patescibacteria group bacterium]
MQKHWQIIDDSGDNDTDPSISNLHPVAIRMLKRRGLNTAEEIDHFLNPDWERDVHDPFLFTQMQQAVDRIFDAIERAEHVVIHGDYDADGVTGSVVLASTLQMLAGANSKPGPSTEDYVPGDDSSKFLNVLPLTDTALSLDIYIPHREREGYGLNMATVDRIAERGTHLLITVDCGVANAGEIDVLKEKGIDTIVVDHHQFNDKIPDAICIHPSLPEETYPFKNLAAVGVAWKVAHALIIEARKRGVEIPAGYEKWLLDLVSIATVTDIVPLVGENRTLEVYGLKVLNKLRRPGFRALVNIANWKKGELDSESVGFVLGPRINAAGRMEHAFLAVDLLLEQNESRAALKAANLEAVNKSRQKATEILMKEAEHFTKTQDQYSLIFAWSENWSPSLVGLAAGRYTDKFGKPAVFVGKHDGVWIGSGRSIFGYNITEALHEVGGNLLTRFGGHAQACGFSLDSDENVRLFADVMRNHAAEFLREQELKPILKIETQIELKDLTMEFLETLNRFEPFGESNPKPIFMTANLTVLESSMVGATQNHVRALVQDKFGKRQKVIGFYKADLKDIFNPGNQIDIVYDISKSEWNGRTEIQCKLIDARKTLNNK